MRNFQKDNSRLENLRLRLSKIASDLSSLESINNPLHLTTLKDIQKFQILLDEILLKDNQSLTTFFTLIITFLKQFLDSIRTRLDFIPWEQKRLELQEILLDFLKFLKDSMHSY